ncbi:MAG TPA: Mrp/NBP35 family ATP-binding protein [Micropepsaceae bacterium]|jgi:ATP-binding protein involved in chromosome partitioning
MAAPTEAEIIKSLQTVRDSVTGKNVVEAGLIEGLATRGGHVTFAVQVAPERGPAAEPLRKTCEDAVARLPGVLSVTAVLTAHRERNAKPRAPSPPAHGHAHNHGPAPTDTSKGIAGVGSIVAVASGKGGVGKSTVAVNLALGLSALGLRVGLLDADIYGPSVPRLLAITEKPRSDGKKLFPIEKFGLKAMSIGFLVDEDKPMIWRGPMVQSAITQMLGDVEWSPLDVLVVDMPPGTGDAQLTLAQRVPLKGAIIVSTPQDLALIDARKGLNMFRKTEVPVLGIVENMSLFICPNCGHESHIFGHGGARATARDLGCDFLGEIPLVPSIRETSDAGTPIVAASPNSPEARAFVALAQIVADKLSTGTIRPAPKIIID